MGSASNRQKARQRGQQTRLVLIVVGTGFALMLALVAVGVAVAARAGQSKATATPEAEALRVASQMQSPSLPTRLAPLAAAAAETVVDRLTADDSAARREALGIVKPRPVDKKLLVEGPMRFDPVEPELTFGASLYQMAESDPRWDRPKQTTPMSSAAVRVAFTGTIPDMPPPSFGTHDLIVWIGVDGKAIWFTGNTQGTRWREQVAGHIAGLKAAREEAVKESARPPVRPNAGIEGEQWSHAELLTHLNSKGLRLASVRPGNGDREPKGDALYFYTFTPKATPAGVWFAWVDENDGVVAVTRYPTAKAAHIASVNSRLLMRWWGRFTIHTSGGSRGMVESIASHLPGSPPAGD